MKVHQRPCRDVGPTARGSPASEAMTPSPWPGFLDPSLCALFIIGLCQGTGAELSFFAFSDCFASDTVAFVQGSSCGGMSRTVSPPLLKRKHLDAISSQLVYKAVLRFSSVVNRVQAFKAAFLFFFFSFFTAVVIPFFVFVAIVSCKTRLIKFLWRFL